MVMSEANGTALVIEGLANARDLGGLLRDDGTRTPRGVFVRAEQLSHVTPDGWDAIRRHGVQTVIDLRRPAERTGEVPRDVTRIDVDLDGDEPEFWAPYEADGRWGTPLYYGAHLRELPAQMVTVLAAITDAAPGGVLFHCGAGWDRTGLVAAVLLRAGGVTRDAATADYLQSYTNAVAMERISGHPAHAAQRMTVLERHGHTPASAFDSMYDALDVDLWFREANLRSDVRSAVRTWRNTLSDHRRV